MSKAGELVCGLLSNSDIWTQGDKERGPGGRTGRTGEGRGGKCGAKEAEAGVLTYALDARKVSFSTIKFKTGRNRRLRMIFYRPQNVNMNRM